MIISHRFISYFTYMHSFRFTVLGFKSDERSRTHDYFSCRFFFSLSLSVKKCVEVKICTSCRFNFMPHLWRDFDRQQKMLKTDKYSVTFIKNNYNLPLSLALLFFFTKRKFRTFDRCHKIPFLLTDSIRFVAIQ